MNEQKCTASFRAWSILLLVAGLAGVPAAKADILRLRDGRMFTGEFLGATKDQIWFQADAPANMIGPTAYSVMQVESLTFGPAPKQSQAEAAPARRFDRSAMSSRNSVDAILVALAREPQKTDRPPDQ